MSQRPSSKGSFLKEVWRDVVDVFMFPYSQANRTNPRMTDEEDRDLEQGNRPMISKWSVKDTQIPQGGDSDGDSDDSDESMMPNYNTSYAKDTDDESDEEEEEESDEEDQGHGKYKPKIITTLKANMIKKIKGGKLVVVGYPNTEWTIALCEMLASDSQHGTTIEFCFPDPTKQDVASQIPKTSFVNGINICNKLKISFNTNFSAKSTNFSPSGVFLLLMGTEPSDIFCYYSPYYENQSAPQEFTFIHTPEWVGSNNHQNFFDISADNYNKFTTALSNPTTWQFRGMNEPILDYYNRMSKIIEENFKSVTSMELRTDFRDYYSKNKPIVIRLDPTVDGARDEIKILQLSFSDILIELV